MEANSNQHPIAKHQSKREGWVFLRSILSEFSVNSEMIAFFVLESSGYSAFWLMSRSRRNSSREVCGSEFLWQTLPQHPSSLRIFWWIFGEWWIIWLYQRDARDSLPLAAAQCERKLGLIVLSLPRRIGLRQYFLIINHLFKRFFHSLPRSAGVSAGSHRCKHPPALQSRNSDPEHYSLRWLSSLHLMTRGFSHRQICIVFLRGFVQSFLLFWLIVSLSLKKLLSETYKQKNRSLVIDFS